MAESNPKVMAMVDSELRRNPEISNAELLEKARGIDKSIEQLSARQFNATYPLQVKRALKPAKRGRRTTKGATKRTVTKRGRKPASKGARRRTTKRATRGAGKRTAKGATKRARKGATKRARKDATKRARKGATKRRVGRPAGRRTGGKAAGSVARDRVRGQLVALAKDVAAAEGKALVDVIAGIDRYVDRVMKAAG